MPSSVVTHLIGYTSLLVIMYIVMLFTSFVSGYVVNNSESRVLKASAESIALQIKYALNAGSETNVTLDYPLWSSSKRPYNIIIGYGWSIKSRYSFLGYLNDTRIYVVALSVDERVYGVSEICNTTFNGYTIVIPEGSVIFGSTRLVMLSQHVSGTQLILEFNIIGEKTP